MASKLETLVREAAKATAEIERLGGMDTALTPKAYLAASLDVPGAAKAEVELLRTEIEKPENSVLKGAIRRMAHTVKDFKRSSPLVRARDILIGDQALTVLARLRVTPASLFALCAEQLVAEQPRSFFGNATRVGEVDEKVEVEKGKLANLYAQIRTAWSGEDVRIEVVTENHARDGLCRLTINFTGNAVYVGHDMPDHLVAWVRANDGGREAA